MTLSIQGMSRLIDRDPIPIVGKQQSQGKLPFNGPSAGHGCCGIIVNNISLGDVCAKCLKPSLLPWLAHMKSYTSRIESV